jgi:hypothetical protein
LAEIEGSGGHKGLSINSEVSFSHSAGLLHLFKSFLDQRARVLVDLIAIVPGHPLVDSAARATLLAYIPRSNSHVPQRGHDIPRVKPVRSYADLCAGGPWPVPSVHSGSPSFTSYLFALCTSSVSMVASICF